MANSFPYTKTKSMEAEDGVVWTNQIVTQTRNPLNFSNTNISLSDSLNDTYVTAVDENETHYLSVLESTHDDTLEDIHNLTLSNQKLIVQDNISGVDSENEHENNFTLTDSGEQQVVIFNVEGSDEIYGIQLAQDDEGNVHKYQFQFRKTEDGQLEAMPETVQLLLNEEEQGPNVESTKELADNPENQIVEETFETPVYLQEDIEQEESSTHLLLPETEENVEEDVGVEEIYEEQENVSSKVVANNSLMVFIKGEQMENQEEQEENLPEQILLENYQEEEEIIDMKPGIDHINIKEELLLEKTQNYRRQQIHGDEELESHNNLNEDCTSEADSCSTTENTNENEETIISYQPFDAESVEEYEDTETLETQAEEERFEQLFIEEKNYDDQEVQQDALNTNDEATNVLIVEKGHGVSDIEDYEVVEGLPVTADGEINEDTSSSIYQEPEILYTEPDSFAQALHIKEMAIQKTTNILKQPTNINKSIGTKKKTILYYMVSNTDQKENLNSLSNPRSLLKTNVDKVSNEENMKRIQREKLLERRQARSKEAIQAKMFNNFINKTTIAHAPIRQTRLPRKQEIKPVDTRRDEEIIVKEVMVSSKGFIESVSERLKSLDKIEITSIELSDSDEEYDPKNSTKKKKKLKKTKPINGDISDDSDASIIEILQSDEDSETTENVKNDRGRSKKDVGDKLKRIRGKHSKSGDESSPQKKSRTEESSEVDSDNGKKEITCPHCPKTFPSQNSLSTHIQHHNLENSLRNSKKIPPTEYKHKCETCQQTFKNSFLLKRHVCGKNDTVASKYTCGVCTKSFKDIVTFNVHKKTHIKANLVKSTSIVTISPKKFLPRPSTSAFKAPTNPGPTFKCRECLKVCSTQNLLSIHEKSHKKFVCTNCNVTFASKLLFNSHVRMKCVKTASPKDKRLSFKIRRSYVHSPRRISTVPKNSVGPSATMSRPSTSSNNAGNTRNTSRTSSSNFGLNASKKSTNHSTPGLNSSIMSKSINHGLNTSSMIRTLDVQAQCDSCPMKFSSLTNLFKHKVRSHGLSTPDKKVLEPKKKTLHKPLNVHGGIPAHDRLNKAFQEIRKKLVLMQSEETEATKPNSNVK